MLPSLSKSQNIFQILQDREIHHKTMDLENFLNNRLVENLKNENYATWKSQKVDSSIHYDRLLEYDPKSKILIFSNKPDSKLFMNTDVILKAGYIHSKNHAWTYGFDQSYRLTICKIAREFLVVSNSIIENNEELYSVIHLINLYTGKKLAEISDDSKIIQSCVNAKEKKIFTYSSDSMTKEWNFDGSWCRNIEIYPHSAQNNYHQIPEYFFSKDHYLVRVFKAYITTKHEYIIDTYYDVRINDFKNDKQTTTKVYHTIKSIFLYKKYLFLGWNNSSKIDPSDFGIMDINSGNFIVKLKIFKNYSSKKSTKANAVEAILCRQNLIFLAHSSGEIMIMNLANYTFKMLEKQNKHITHLYLKGKILISSNLYSPYPKINFWDIESLTKITEIQTPHLNNFSFINGKLYLIQNSSLDIRDYLISGNENIVDSFSSK